MEYAIFPMKEISISQKYKPTHRAWDLTGVSPDYEQPSTFYAPCRVKIINLLPYDGTGYYNTVIFGSCDENGNQAQVMCADGVARVLTFACTHIDTADYNAMNYYIGKKYESGDECYREGIKGVDENNSHVHLEVGPGWQTTKGNDACLVNTVNEDGDPLIENLFYQLSGFNFVTNAGANGYTFETVSSRVYSEEEITPTESTGIYLQGVLGGFYIRNTAGSGTIKTTVPAGAKAEILEFVPGFIAASDGNSYQWARVKYGQYEGYAQLDLHQDYKIVCDSTFDPIYLRAVGSQFNIRSQKNTTSTILGTVAAGARIKLIAISSTHENGGYQWARVDYNGQVGFVQIDTVGFNQLEF